MNANQTELIARLAKINIVASFNGSFLNCEKLIVDGKKKIRNKASFVFDDAEGCYGARLIKSSLKGTYGFAIADWAFDIITKFSEETGKQEVI
jgi:hypothetical protein